MPATTKPKIKKGKRKPAMPKVSAEEKAKAQPWTEAWPFTTKHQPAIDAQSFNDWVAEVLPFTKDMKAYVPPGDQKHAIPVGRYRFAMHEFPVYRWASRWEGLGIPFLPMGGGSYYWKRAALQTAQGDKRGNVRFTAPVRIPVLYKGKTGCDVVMSLAPMEVLTQRAGLRKARGRVLIGGMGLGWLARRVMEKKTVKHVTVVDIDWDVCKYFGDPLREEFGSEFVREHGDIFEYANIYADKFDTVLVDIWDSYQAAPYDRSFKSLKERHERVWGWGDCGAG